MKKLRLAVLIGMLLCLGIPSASAREETASGRCTFVVTHIHEQAFDFVAVYSRFITVFPHVTVEFVQVDPGGYGGVGYTTRYNIVPQNQHWAVGTYLYAGVWRVDYTEVSANYTAYASDGWYCNEIVIEKW